MLLDLEDNGKITYIDLWNGYQKNGILNPDYTIDGIHLKENAYDIWYRQIEPYIRENNDK